MLCHFQSSTGLLLFSWKSQLNIYETWESLSSVQHHHHDKKKKNQASIIQITKLHDSVSTLSGLPSYRVSPWAIHLHCAAACDLWKFRRPSQQGLPRSHLWSTSLRTPKNNCSRDRVQPLNDTFNKYFFREDLVKTQGDEQFLPSRSLHIKMLPINRSQFKL